MKLGTIHALGIAAALTVASSAIAAPVNQAFTYQGVLKSEGLPFTGVVRLEFRLYDAASGGSQVGSTVLFATHAVEDGLVSVELDFGSTAFPGNDRWLEAEVDDFILTPRTKVLPSPYAMYAGDADRLDGMDVTDFDDEYVNEGQADAVSTAMLRDQAVTTPKMGNGVVTSQQLADAAVTTAKLATESVTANEMADNIDASGIGFNAATVNRASIFMGTWYEGSAVPFLNLHGGDCQISGTGSTSGTQLRAKNNMGLELLISVITSPPAISHRVFVGGGATVDFDVPHYYPFQLIVSEAGAAPDWTCVIFACENDSRGAFVCIDHDQ